MLFEQFMNDKFPNLVLKPPLFYNWDIGISFELGDPLLYDSDTNYYMEQKCTLEWNYSKHFMTEAMKLRH